MSKQYLVEQLAGELDLNKTQTDIFLTKVFDCIQKGLSEGREISIPKFGKFSIKKSLEREGRNPRTGEKILISSSNIVKFKSAKNLKEKMN